MNKQAVIFLAHGTKDPQANSKFEELVSMARCQLEAKWIETVFFRSALPIFLHDTIGQLYEKGCRNIHLVPAFFLKGKHIEIELPEAIAEAKKQYPDLTITVSDILSSHPKIIDILIDLAKTKK